MKKKASKAPTRARATPRAPAAKASFPLPALKKGEAYAGVLLDKKGRPFAHLVELAKTGATLTHDEALAFAKTQGGELPDRQEAALLYANRKHDHAEAWYWTRETHASDGAYAWFQTFGDGFQYYDDRGYRYRARAVRRVSI